MVTTRRTSTRAPAQNIVEYGLLVGVAALAFVAGLSLLMGAEGWYLNTSQTKPDPTAVVGALPKHAVDMQATCAPGSPVYTGQAFPCVLIITDLYTLGPAQIPRGAVALTSSTGTFGACNLGPATSSSSTCSFTYTPIVTREQNMQAVYSPTSNHLAPQDPWLLTSLIYARDKTHIDASSACVGSVELAEPSRCNVSVYDEFTNQFVPNVSVTFTTTTAPGLDTGTFSDDGLYSPQTPSPYVCGTGSTGVCLAVFRSNASTLDEGSYALTASFGRDADHEASPIPTTPLKTLVKPPDPTKHSPPATSIQVSCSSGSSRSSPLFINQFASTPCSLTVTDNNGNDYNGDPTYVTPAGTVTWVAQPNNGSAGSLSQGSCVLQRLTDQAGQCQTLYTPSLLGTPDWPDYSNTHYIQAVYSGDVIHPPLNGTTSVYVRDVHQVQVYFTCSLGTNLATVLVISNADVTQCTVNVTDTAPNPATPSGNVGWSVTGNTPSPGAFSPSPCSLQFFDNSTANCQTNYTPSSVGPPYGQNQTNLHHLRATYSGDWLHQAPSNPAGPLDLYVKN